MSIRSPWRRCVSAWLAAGLLALALPALADTAAGRNDPRELPPVPKRVEVDLKRGDRGKSALSTLLRTGRINDWGAGYGMTRAQVEEMFNKDDRAYVDRRGNLMFVEHINTTLTAPTVAGTATVPADVLSQVFTLHSRPGSQRKLYLDFDGHVTQGTAWNSSYGLASITNPAFDLDGNPGTFSNAERQVIYGIWQRVKEDYAPFDIDVTTEEPPADQMTRTSAQDATFGMRVVITRDFTPGTIEGACRCGGFAYVGVFASTSEANKPAFVFYNNLANSEKFIAEAVTHEAGHTMGLSHDGVGTVGYYEGQGTSAVTGWAPIMGVGYYKPLTQWSKGEYSNANNKEDDYMVMQTNGVRFAPDEHGNTLATASVLTPSLENGFNRYRATGVIQGPTDVDMFRFTAGAGALTITVSPDSYDPNLDVVSTLMNGSGAQIATANPLSALNAVVQFNIVTPGAYYLAVRGTGNGNPASTGYSAYGSVGSYSVDIATLTSTAPPPPVPAITASTVRGTAPLAVTFLGQASGTGTLTYAWDYGDGTTAAGATPAAKTFQNPGTYTVTLRVTDPVGQSGTTSVSVTANAPVTAKSMGVAQITVSGVVPDPRKPDAFARAIVTVRDSNGAAVRNAAVSGTWSGVVNQTVMGTTNSAGQVTLASPRTPFVGTFNFTVNNITAAGYVYDPKRNVLTSRSITF